MNTRSRYRREQNILEISFQNEIPLFLLPDPLKNHRTEVEKRDRADWFELYRGN